MRKLNYLLLGLAGLVMASCSQDDIVGPAQGNGNFNVTVKLPGDLATRAMSDGTAANNLYYAVYDASNDALVYHSQQSFNGNLETIVSMNLAMGKNYKVAFFAQSPASVTDKVYNFDPDNAVMTVNYDNMTNASNNADDYDCFYNLYTTTTIGEEAQSVSVTLYRPVAQINWGADDFKNGTETAAIESAFGANGAYLTSTLTTQAYNTFSLLDNDVDTSAGMSDVTLANFTAPNAIFPVDVVDGESPYQYVGMQFLLAPKSTTVYDLNLTIDNSNNPTPGAEIISYDVNVSSAPVQANFRTNIYGSLLTDNIQFVVNKDPNWNTDINIPYGNEIDNGLYLEGYTYTITSPEGLVAYSKIANAASQQGMSKYTVLLASDLDMSTIQNYVPFSNAGATFDGQDHTVYNLTVKTTNGASAGFMSSAIGTVSNLHFVDANVSGTFKAGVLAGDGLCAKINNVTVTGAKVTSVPWNKGSGYDDGNNVGGIVGYLSAEGTASLTNCSVSNSTIRAYRILGGIVGRLNGVGDGMTFENNTADNVTIICDLATNGYNSSLTPENVPVGEIYGQNLTTYTVPTNNTAENVSIVYVTADGNISLDSFAALEAIADLGSSFTYGKTVTFPENTEMDLDGASVESIGFNALSSDFNNCTIDFQNSTISNFTVIGVGNGSHTGLFANFHGVLKNLNVENMTITNNAEGNCGIVGYLVGTMENVNVKNINISTPEKNVGALVGLCSATSNIIDCSVDGAVLSGQARVGGLIGCINDNPNVTFTNCSINNVQITCTTPKTAGTLIGQTYGNWSQTGCTVTNTTINGEEVTELGADQY